MSNCSQSPFLRFALATTLTVTGTTVFVPLLFILLAPPFTADRVQVLAAGLGLAWWVMRQDAHRNVDQPPAGIRFSLATALAAIGSFCILLGISKWAQVFPYWTILPSLLIVAAWMDANCGHDRDWCWSWFTIGWLFAFVDTTISFIRSFEILGGMPSASHFQLLFRHALFTSTAVPMFLSIPAILAIAKLPQGSRSLVRKWIVSGLVLGFLSVTMELFMLTILIVHMAPD